MVKKISNIQKKNDTLKDKINELYLEANNKGLVNVRSTIALSNKMNNARTTTLEKILKQGKKLIKDNKTLTWASIQKLDKNKKSFDNDNDKYEPIIKNNKGNIFKKKYDDEYIIKNNKGNIFAQKPKKIKFDIKDEKDVNAKRFPKDIRFKLKEHSILKAVQTFNFEPTQSQSKDYRLFLQSLIKPLINQNKGMKRTDGNFKFFIRLVGRFYQPKDGQEDDRTLFSKMQTYTNDAQLKANIMSLIDELIKKIEEIQDMTNGSGWLWVYGKSIEVQFNKYRPIGGSSYIELPEKIAKKQACINVKNTDNECFKWAVLSMLHPAKSHGERVNHYKNFVDKYDWSMLKFPAIVKDIIKFETTNKIKVNVFILQGIEVQPLYIPKNDYSKEVDLLLFTGKNKNGEEINHYVGIKSLSRLLTAQCYENNKHKAYICKRCLTARQSQEALNKHLELCLHNDSQKAVLPEEGKNIVKFTHDERQEKVPFIIYADFECILEKLEYNKHDANKSSTEKTEKHIVCGFSYKVVSIEPEHTKETIIYRGYDSGNKFIKAMLKEQDKIMELCKSEEGVCPRFIPVVFHNAKNYDSHIILKNIVKNIKRVSCIPNNEEKYISFSIEKLRFIDSFQFMASSLEKLVENQMKGMTEEQCRQKLKYNNEVWGENFMMMTRKGVYPYEYMNSFDKFNQTTQPNKNDFYSSLSDEHIKNEDYQHFLKVWKHMNISNLGEYHDLYLKSDVLLLCDVFENFRTFCINEYGLDPSHYFTLPGFAWDALLKSTNTELELITDVDMYLFIEQGKRGGVSVISTKYAKANNPYCLEYNKDKERSYIIDLDANNLYGWAMSQYLPVDGYKWNTDTWTVDKIMKLGEEDNKGYFFKVDLEYPSEIHDLHSDYPLAPENVIIKSVSEYSKYLMNKHDIKHDRVGKLVPNLHHKHGYVCHYRNLKQYLELGMKLIKVHQVVEFNQNAWMKPFIDFNTEKRKKAKDDFEKDLFKLMNNSVFGKTMENLRGRIDFELINNEKRFLKVSRMPTFKRSVIFNKYLTGVHKSKTRIELNKPIPVGTAILDLSKTLMYDFHYNYIKKKYGNNALLLATDTDSLKYFIKTNDLYKDMKVDNYLFDMSEYNEKHFCYDETNKKVLGKMKDETKGEPILEFVGLRAKMYSQLLKDDAKKVCKGIKKSVIKKVITHEDYRNCVFNDSIQYNNMKTIRSFSHNLYTVSVQKTSLSSYDNKRYVLDDGLNTIAHGHYKIKQLDEFSFVSKGNIFSKTYV